MKFTTYTVYVIKEKSPVIFSIKKKDKIWPQFMETNKQTWQPSMEGNCFN